MSGEHEPLLAGSLLGFPPRSHHILLPEQPAAARAALALYDATLLHQRIAAAVGDALLRVGLGSLLRTDGVPGALDQGWWRRWCHEVGRDVVGDVGRIGFRTWEDRIAGLLFDQDGRPVAFVKVWHTSRHLSPWHPSTDLETDVIAELSQAPTTTFRTPAILDEGSFEGHHYVVLEPLPPGRHHRLPPAPDRLHPIVDEVQARLADVHRPSAVPAHHVMSHGDLTPRNVRVASDGSVWVFDWEYARWAPPLADELRFWVTDGALRSLSRPRHHGRRITTTLLRRGSPEDIAEALSWHDFVTPREAAIRAVISRKLSAGE